jgi:Na+-driven multidrug efflux pump
VSQIVVPLGLCALFDVVGTLEPHEIWTAIVAGHLMRCTLSVWRFRQERWRRIAVDLGPAPA